MNLIFVRHGETEGNASGIIQGHLPGKLSKKGVEQSKMVARRLKNEKIDAIFCSDLGRAIETAKEIRFYHPKTPFIITEKLREIYFGEWEGKTRENVGFIGSYKPQLPNNAETREKILYRAQDFLGEIKEKYMNRRVLLVAHNAINKALITAIKGGNSEEIRDMETQHNTAVNLFYLFENGAYKKILYNCVAHLRK